MNSVKSIYFVRVFWTEYCCFYYDSKLNNFSIDSHYIMQLFHVHAMFAGVHDLCDANRDFHDLSPDRRS